MEDSATSVPSSIWASVNSWFTSTVFFVLLNLMIATIVFTSNLPTNNQQNYHQQQEQEEELKQNSQNENHRNQPKIVRSPSILHRLKSFNFHPQQQFSQETHHHLQALEVAATQYVFNQPLHYDFGPTSSGQLSGALPFSPRNQTHEVELPDTETHEIQRAIDAHEDELTDEFQSLDEVYSMLKGGHHDRTKSDGDFPRNPPAKMKKSASLKEHVEEEEEMVETRRPATMREREVAVRAMEDDDVEVDAKADDFINKFKNDLMLQRIESITKTKGSVSGGTAK